jgi:hypothetical protein
MSQARLFAETSERKKNNELETNNLVWPDMEGSSIHEGTCDLIPQIPGNAPITCKKYSQFLVTVLTLNIAGLSQ